MKENLVLEKAYKFALRIVELYKHLSEVRKEFVMSKLVLSSGTQIGARIEIAQEADSRSSFIHEMSVALQKAVETRYWLRLLHGGGFISKEEFDSCLFDCEELIALLISIVKSSKGLKQPLSLFISCSSARGTKARRTSISSCPNDTTRRNRA